MTPGTEGAGLFLHPGLARQLGHEVAGNEIAKLTQNGKLAAAWSGRFIFFHPCRVAGQSLRFKLSLFPLWDDCEILS